MSLHGNSYEVDAALVGRTVEVVFDPLDLTTLEVRYQSRSMGHAVPHRIGRHVHPQARPDLPPPAAGKTGVDYLALIAQQHRAQVADQINYRGILSAAEDAAPQPDPALEAELASFALLVKGPATTSVSGTVSTELPGQLDLTELTDLPDVNSSEGQQ